MKKILRCLTMTAVAKTLLTACHDLPQQPSTKLGNFEALWDILDRHYCFFAEKDVDWQEVHDRYKPRISEEMTSEELFNVCAEMLAELRDGHTNLSAPFNVSYYRNWWSDYPQNFDERLIEQYYFNFNYLTIGSMSYGILPQNVAYIRYPSFSATIGERNLDYVLAYCATADGLIINIRDNGGGDMTNVETLVARFITEPTLAGYISHKTGPGHDDFSQPFPYTYNPAGHGRMRWAKPTVVLTNRSTFSAANNFVSVMQYLPQVKIAGARTGGGSGMPFNSELPNGWGVRFSACSVLDPRGLSTEFGIDPTEGCAIDLDPDAALQGRDTMLDFAISLITR